MPVPRDLTKVKSKVAMSLTLRQIICFGCAGAVGVPAYLLARGAIGNSAAVLVMIGLMLPAFFIAMYEKDGRPAEKIMLDVIRSRWFFPTKRPYRTENFYHIIEKEALVFEFQSKATERRAGEAKQARQAKQTKPSRIKRNTEEKAE